MTTLAPARVDAGKPPYSVPTMADIRAVEPNGYTLVSTFSGCGGSSTGFRMEGFRSVYANEFVHAAAEAYRANWPDTYVDERDIRSVTAPEVLELGGVETFDVLEGSPPCSSFSMSGKRDDGWGETKHYSEERAQRTDDLFDEYIRLLGELQPRVFVAENVTGMVAGKALGYYLRFRDSMASKGYVVEARILEARWMGVPQARKRLIFMGVRQDEHTNGMRHIWPEPLPYGYSIREAIGGMDIITRSFVTGRETVAENVAPSIVGYSIDDHYNSAVGNHRKRLNLKRNPIDGPAGTIVAIGGTSAGTGSIVHPLERRKYAICELKALSSFPADYILPGTFGQQWERIGRSVPPLMMRGVARCVRRMLDGEVPA